MTTNKRKKVVRYRGSKTHGGGSMKKRRGAGNRGGRGMAGTGKRAKTKKPSIIQMFGSNYFGKFGFKRPSKILIKIKAVNLGYIEDNFDNLVTKGIIKKDTLNLADMKKNKLLASGNLTKKLKIKAQFASKKAVEKVQKAGGSVEVAEVVKKVTEEPKEEA
ncbi:MAG: uL15 family ribosomal protein [Nanoarchaeota archaeon]|nr:uL15 family ribosomal protein [Nanoarchaeota archaeon]MBU4241660.1 uL15 family ribosomal protein [Nanoarchaeota archaeon]MBU4352456.1 uL15 family ribosomal protein [Nanoarchaeota archaeon]MBU4456250.1 uL15 family ribosomal protein [Nanoarchaeota archaeon]MCG2720254.1 uL15 family ribosomal protein [Nanoarchaeota archaeon]